MKKLPSNPIRTLEKKKREEEILYKLKKREGV